MATIILELTEKEAKIYDEAMKRLMKQQCFLPDCPTLTGWTG